EAVELDRFGALMDEVADDVHRRETGVGVGGAVAAVVVDEVNMSAAAAEGIRAAAADYVPAADQMIRPGAADHRPGAARRRGDQPFGLIAIVADARQAKDRLCAPVPQRN